jgi:hypothetical protein
VSAGTSTLRGSPRNRKITITTSTPAMNRVENTSSMAASTNTERSKPTTRCIPSGQLIIHKLDLFLYQPPDRQGIGFALLDDTDPDHGLGVAPEQAAGLGATQFYAGDIAQAHQVAVRALGQHQLAKVLIGR